MIVTKISELPDLTGENELCIDVETTSFDDDEKALHPFNGHRVAGYGLMNKAREWWYIPVRHRCPGAKNLDIDEVKKWLHKLARRPRAWIGHNLKFDARFSYQDGMYLEGELIDTMVLARLVNPLRFNASLNILAKEYCDIESQKEGDRVSEYLKAAKSKDYGVVPIDIMGTYCGSDLRATYTLKERLVEELPEECYHLWGIEKEATRTLLNSELHGVYVPRRKLVTFARDVLHELVQKQEEVNELVGEDVDVNSNKELTRVLTKKLCVTPREFTKAGAPSWGADVLREYGTQACDLLADLKELSYTHASFGHGWLKRLTVNETLHPNFKQYGTRSGRLSCEDPSFQVLPVRARAQVYARPGCQLVAIDASQVEFRLFAHYTNSPKIVPKYRDDASTDYHQQVADMLGIPRSPAKRLNFGFIYGMGRAKLESQLIAFIRQAVNENDTKVLNALSRFNFREPVDERNAGRVAAAVYSHMHRILPEIKQFARRVNDTVAARGYVRNVYRRYYYAPAEFAHKLRNYVIQGAAADLLKDWMASIRPVLKKYGARMLANVHDELLLEVPSENLMMFIEEMVQVLESPHVELRVPIKVDVSVCAVGESWAKKMELPEYLERSKCQ